MRLNPITGLAFQQLLARLLRRALLAIVIFICAIVAISQFTAAGSLALETEIGAWQARLVIGAVYGLLGVAGIAFFRSTRRPAAAPSSLAKKREASLMMLIEAVLLGYGTGRKTGRTS